MLATSTSCILKKLSSYVSNMYYQITENLNVLQNDTSCYIIKNEAKHKIYTKVATTISTIRYTNHHYNT